MNERDRDGPRAALGLRVGLLALLASTALSTGVWAQDKPVAPPSETPAGSGANQVAEIVVTATKRAENLQDVPISVQALGAAKLEEHQVNDLDDYVKLLPSVSFQSYGPGQSQVFFRGISSGGDGGYGVKGGSPTSSLYIDDIPLTTVGNTVDLHVYDISRVEALSGPQGTLFGANSLSGTLRLITNAPDPHKFSAGYDLQGNTFGKGDPGGELEGFVNLPVTDKIALRVVGFYEHDGGYIDNVPSTRTYTLGDDDPTNDITVDNKKYSKKNFNDVSTFGGRVALKVDLDENWSITPSVIYQHQKANGAFLYDPAEGDLKVNDFTPDFNVDEWYQAALTVQGKIANLDVVYVGGYFGRTIKNVSDYSYYTVAYDRMPGYTKFPDGKGGFLDPTQPFAGYDQSSKQTHELRISTPKSDRLRAIGGVFYQRQTDRNLAAFTIPGLGGIPDSPVTGVNSPNLPLLSDAIYATNLETIERDLAVFGEVAYDILPNLTLTGGLRGYYYHNTTNGFSGFAGNAQTSYCYPTDRTDIPCADAHAGTSDSGETHKVNLSWKIDPDRLVYFTYSTGFRPGGINRRPGVNPYVADTLSNYEIGAKTSWFNRSLIVNGAVFHEEWDNVQYGLPAIGGAGVINTYNAGNARVNGVEADATWRIGSHLTLSSSATYVDARLTTSFCGFDANLNTDCSEGVAAPKGTRLPIQPPFKINATARYAFRVGPLDSYVQGGVLHQGGTRTWLTDAEYDALGPTKAFTTFDFSAGFVKGDIHVEAFIQNAFDGRGSLSINTVCVPTICGFRPRFYPTKPQLFGIKIGQQF